MTALAAALLASAAAPALAAPASPAPQFPSAPQAPKGAPNVMIILLDDVGFGASSTFGGVIPTPTLDALAAGGARYNSFHTTSLCSPTRAALLTGRNPHSVGAGIVTEMATGHPGYTSVIPASAAMIPRVLQMNGYSTAMFGKHHNTPQWEEGPAAPATRKPNGLGFDYFYGFLGGATNQFAPALYENLNPVEPPTDDAGYSLDRDLADHALSWLRMQATQAPGKPFLLYYAPGTLHAPVQAPKAWIDRFRGQFDDGWDVLRAHIHERQKRLGIIPANTDLAPTAPNARKWESLSADERRLASRYMEVYAAALASCDHEVGRIIDELKRTGQFDNTLIFFIIGDNGGSSEGGAAGAFNYLNRLNEMPETVAENLQRLDQLGGPDSFPVVPIGWTRATNSPFQWNKGIASHRGGTGNGLVISWPGHVREARTVRGQFHHVIDIAPTIYEATGVKPPEMVDGVAQQPLEGVSMAYTLREPGAVSPHREQYFEMWGSMGLYQDGWLLSNRPGITNASLYDQTSSTTSWELYDLRKDFSQSHDVAAQEPTKVAEMAARFRELAAAHNVNPISSDKRSRINDGGRPGVVDKPGLHRFFSGPARYTDGAFADVRNRSWSMTARIAAPASGGDGVIVTQGGRFAGWGLVVTGGRPQFIYRLNERDEGVVRLSGSTALSPGAHTLKVDFRYDGGGMGKGGKLSLSVDGRIVAERRLEQTVGLMWGEDASVGRDTGTALTADYRLPYLYTGQIQTVEIDTRADVPSRAAVR